MAFGCSTEFSFERLEVNRLENFSCNLRPEGRISQFSELLSGIHFSLCMLLKNQLSFGDASVLASMGFAAVTTIQGTLEHAYHDQKTYL